MFVLSHKPPTVSFLYAHRFVVEVVVDGWNFQIYSPEVELDV